MQLKKGSGWKACYEEDTGRYFGEYGGIQSYHLYELTKELYDRLDEAMTEGDAGTVMYEGRHLYMSVDDRCGPPYTIVFDDDYEKLCPWASVMKSGKVWPDELTDAAVELFESEKNNREQRRKKREKRRKNKVCLQPMDRSLLHEYYKNFVMDADIFMDMSNLRDYTYSPERVDAYFDRLQSQKDRVDFLIMSDDNPIGEIALKHMDNTAKQCELSIHLQSDAVKNKGYGTQAERLILEYAFQTLGMTTVVADSVLKNKRSQHTLEKVGFRETGRDETFVYYQITQADWLKL